MAFVTTGLTNGGLTTHYQIDYDDSLSQADGRDRANALLGVCEDDYNLVSGWFGGISLTVGTPITVRINPGPAASARWGPPIDLVPGNGSDIGLVRYLLVSEIVEMFMGAQNHGGFDTGKEGHAGESRSRFLAGQFLIANGLGVTEPLFRLASLNNTPVPGGPVFRADSIAEAYSYAQSLIGARSLIGALERQLQRSDADRPVQPGEQPRWPASRLTPGRSASSSLHPGVPLPSIRAYGSRARDAHVSLSRASSSCKRNWTAIGPQASAV